jgi:hypothetical protein
MHQFCKKMFPKKSWWKNKTSTIFLQKTIRDKNISECLMYKENIAKNYWRNVEKYNFFCITFEEKSKDAIQT